MATVESIPDDLAGDRLERVETFASVTKLGRTKAYDLVKQGVVRSVLIGRCRRIPVSAIREYLAGLNGGREVV